MPNNQPIFTRVGDIQWSSTVLSANTSVDLSSGLNIYLTFSADTTSGGYVQRLRIKPNNGAGVNNNQTVLRVWLNNGGATTTAANNTLIDEISLPATTGSATAALPVYEIPLNIALPPGYAIYVTLGSNAGTGSSGYRVTAIGGKY